jgi:hypothetical protein
VKISLFTLSMIVALCAGVFGTSRALATTHHAATKTVNIVMHDPGCHWFKVNGKLTTKDTVRASKVKLVDQDEAALKVVSRHGTVGHIPVGKSLVVGHGNYVIMMVGQASDDNYLSLHVR